MKKRILKIVKFTYFFCCFMFILSNRAYAYVDATSATYLIQAIVGVFVAIGAVITIQRHKIVAAYRKWHYGRIAKKNEAKALKSMEMEKKNNE